MVDTGLVVTFTFLKALQLLIKIGKINTQNWGHEYLQVVPVKKVPIFKKMVQFESVSILKLA